VVRRRNRYFSFFPLFFLFFGGETVPIKPDPFCSQGIVHLSSAAHRPSPSRNPSIIFPFRGEDRGGRRVEVILFFFFFFFPPTIRSQENL